MQCHGGTAFFMLIARFNPTERSFQRWTTLPPPLRNFAVFYLIKMVFCPADRFIVAFAGSGSLSASGDQVTFPDYVSNLHTDIAKEAENKSSNLLQALFPWGNIGDWGMMDKIVSHQLVYDP